MSHGQLKVLPVAAKSANVIAFPDNAAVLGVTTVNNAPALLLGCDTVFGPAVSEYRVTVLEVGANETIAGPDNADYLGLATSGTRAWAIYRGAP